MSQETSYISRVGTTEPFDLKVARGQITGHETIFKFGFNADVDNATETIWSEGGTYSYLSAASVLKISSSSIADDAAGTGARTVQVYGLDENYDEINETVTLDGQTAVNTTNSFLRVYRMVIRSAGTGGKNAGTVYAGTGTVTTGVPANKFAAIAVGENQTTMAIWTVPAGYTAYLCRATFSVASATANKFVTVSIVARPDGEVFQVQDKVTLNVGSHIQDYKFPISFAEKTDIEVQGIGDASVSNGNVGAGLDIVYVKNTL